MELSEIREKIDAVDDQLLDLFLQRMDRWVRGIPRDWSRFSFSVV